ncbi:MAG TPA: transposase [Actinomycetota bacterium]|jgi:transposase|nr:transposase [Actinomycetota bacterium]
MLARYRYRIDPAPAQRIALAKAFGCARVVYNDALRARQDTYAAGGKLSDTQVQRRVITVAKQTPERAWLGEVASVVLVQACQDARRAWRNWFDSLSGKRRGRRVGHPRLRSKHGRQSIRLTRNGFALHGSRLYVAKVGDLRVRWSRPLPSVPSSVTVIREADGRFYASFVVEAGLGRTRLAKSVHDAGWATFVRLLEQKAAQHGRRVVKVGRWEPTSQTCSTCGRRDGPKPLRMRVWTCGACGVVPDRDVNAARNILKVLVAAGPAETQNACGAGVRPPSLAAAGSEAGTRRGAA